VTSRRFDDLFGGPPRTSESDIQQRHMDIAASIQAVTEDIVLRMARHVYDQTGMHNLVLAGGVALNCVANGRLLREGPFDDIWIQPAAGDAGGALGAALFTWYQLLDNPRSVVPHDAQKGSFLGPSFSSSAIQSFLEREGVECIRIDDEDAHAAYVAQLLDEDKVVGWFHGRMEFGPRALGARSIIGDARSPRMQATMNVKIKFRESFRPFAPVVLQEHAHEWFDLYEDQASPYMLLVAPVLDRHRAPLSTEQIQSMSTDPDLRRRVNVVRSTVPAVTHVDFSARIQTVDRHRNPGFHRVMQAFYKRTGCPVLVNTSFNVRGEPIVCSPADAYRCFMATEMDVLVMENFILLKSAVNGRALDETARAEYLTQFQLD
jgi:carbamoyltransferase